MKSGKLTTPNWINFARRLCQNSFGFFGFSKIILVGPVEFIRANDNKTKYELHIGTKNYKDQRNTQKVKAYKKIAKQIKNCNISVGDVVLVEAIPVKHIDKTAGITRTHLVCTYILKL